MNTQINAAPVLGDEKKKGAYAHRRSISFSLLFWKVMAQITESFVFAGPTFQKRKRNCTRPNVSLFSFLIGQWCYLGWPMKRKRNWTRLSPLFAPLTSFGPHAVRKVLTFSGNAATVKWLWSHSPLLAPFPENHFFVFSFYMVQDSHKI